MIEIIKHGTNIDFVGKFKLAVILSTVVNVICWILIATRMNYGVDFRGGAEISIKTQTPVSLEKLRESMDKGGFKGVSIQTIGDAKDNEFLVKFQSENQDIHAIADHVEVALKKDFSNEGVEMRKVDIVGPKAGAQLRFSGFLAMAWAFIAIMIYIGLRFDYRYAPGAVISLIHDATIVLGMYALLQLEFSLQTVAAVLAVIGYSVNDTVIIYDRIREYEEKHPGGDLKQQMNNAINETLSRTVITHGVTFTVTLVMYFFGGAAIKDFFLAMSCGVVVGTYSSIYIASPFTLMLDNYKKYRDAKVKVV
jgi:preprotein translocase subunit SecF